MGMSSGGGCDESCSRDAADGAVGVVGEIEAGAGRGGRCWGWQWDLSSLRVVEGQLIAVCVGSRRKKEGDEVCSVRFGDMEARRSRVGSRHGEGRKLGGSSGLEARRHEGMQAHMTHHIVALSAQASSRAALFFAPSPWCHAATTMGTRTGTRPLGATCSSRSRTRR